MYIDRRILSIYTYMYIQHNSNISSIFCREREREKNLWMFLRLELLPECLSSFYDHQHEYLNITDTDSYFSLLLYAPSTTKMNNYIQTMYIFTYLKYSQGKFLNYSFKCKFCLLIILFKNCSIPSRIRFKLVLV